MKERSISNSTVRLRRCRCVRHVRFLPFAAHSRAQVRELFTKFGVAGALLDKVVKSISSSDDTLLKFMRKVAYCCCCIVLSEGERLRAYHSYHIN